MNKFFKWFYIFNIVLLVAGFLWFKVFYGFFIFGPTYPEFLKNAEANENFYSYFLQKEKTFPEIEKKYFLDNEHFSTTGFVSLLKSKPKFDIYSREYDLDEIRKLNAKLPETIPLKEEIDSLLVKPYHVGTLEIRKDNKNYYYVELFSFLHNIGHKLYDHDDRVFCKYIYSESGELLFKIKEGGCQLCIISPHGLIFLAILLTIIGFLFQILHVSIKRILQFLVPATNKN